MNESFSPTASPSSFHNGSMDFTPPPQKLFEFALMLWLSALMFLLSGVFFTISALPFKLTRRVSKSADVAGWSVLYFAFSISLVVYNKWLISVWGFNFPISITLMHMILKLCISRVIVRGCRSTDEIPTISPKAYMLFAVPVGATTALDVAASNASFYYVTVTVYTIVKSTALFFVLVYSILYKLQQCDWRLFACTGVILAGVLMSSVKETAFEWIGFTLVLISAALGGYRWALTEVLMHNQVSSSSSAATTTTAAEPSKMNALMTIYVISPASVLTMIPFFFWFEFSSFVESDFYSDAGLFTLVIINVLASGVFAFAMIYVELAVLKRTSSLSLVVIGYVKQMLQICFSAILFHDVLLPLNIAGIAVTFVGMAAYSAVKHHSKANASSSSSAAVMPEEDAQLRGGDGGGGGIGDDAREVFEDISLHNDEEERAGAGGINHKTTTKGYGGLQDAEEEDGDEEMYPSAAASTATKKQQQKKKKTKKGQYEMVQI